MNSAQLVHIRTNILKYTQQQLADAINFKKNSIWRMEKDRQPIEKVTELAIRWLVWKECMIEWNDSDLLSDSVSENVPGISSDSRPQDVDKISDIPAHLQFDLSSAYTVAELDILFLSKGLMVSNDNLSDALCLASDEFESLNLEMKQDAIERFNALFFNENVSISLTKFVYDFYLNLPLKAWLNRRSLIQAWRDFICDQSFQLAN